MFELVEFPSEGAILRGRFYRPAHAAPWPAVVMTHGTTATITMCLDRYAEVFCRAGLAVLLYDHRNFGLSGGEPRQLINPWLQARGYRDALIYLLTRADVDRDRIAAWGDSYSGMIALAVAAQCPACGIETPKLAADERHFQTMQAIFDDGDITGTPETTTGPLPVVSADQIGSPSLLKPIQAYRWFIDYGGRHGTLWENRVIRVVPPTAVPFSAYLAAPFIRGPTLLMAGRNDEMVHCNPDVTSAVFGLMRCRKQWADIDGGHFGLLYCPGEIFEQASAAQCAFLTDALDAQVTRA
ncbi:MAG: alpha/beta hydrolase [Bradyrhizobium sp.]|nr:alpha/beta hydrolase [Bradyrhizobium sp.]